MQYRNLAFCYSQRMMLAFLYVVFGISFLEGGAVVLPSYLRTKL